MAAIALPVCVVVLGFGLQAAAFDRPPQDDLVASNALRELLRFRVMRATQHVGSETMRSTCLQGWYHARHHRRLVPGALVLLGNGRKLYDLGHGVRVVGRSGSTSMLDVTRFLLAACPRFVGARIGTRLLGGNWIDADPATHTPRELTLAFGDRTKPTLLSLDARTDRPLELRLSGTPLRSWSTLEPGGGSAAARPVLRAFRLKTPHARPGRA